MILSRILYVLLVTKILVGSCSAQSEVNSQHMIAVSNEIVWNQFKTGLQYSFVKPAWEITAGIQNNWTPSYSGTFLPFLGPHLDGNYRMFHRKHAEFSVGLGVQMNFRKAEDTNTGFEVGHQQLTTGPLFQYRYFKDNFTFKINVGPAVQVNWVKNKTLEIKENHAFFTYWVRFIVGGIFPKL